MRSRSFFKNPAASLAILACVAALCVGACQKPEDAPDRTSDRPPLTYPVTVSGISSGAYMAVQTHVALSDSVAGVAAIAGGPYHCAQGDLARALGSCVSGDGIDIDSLIAFTLQAANDGRIAATENLRDAKVWVLHGTEDTVVGSGTSLGVAAFYRAFVDPASIDFVDDIPAAHGWPTLTSGADCAELGADFINACDFDAAGSLLRHIIGDIEPGSSRVAADDLSDLDISALVTPGSHIASNGLVYVPPDCHEPAGTCRLHIAFHGCRQGAQFIDRRFAANVGLNEWASGNRIVVLYPQVETSPGNPLGCWDWWGYTGSDYDLANGKQIGTIANIIDAWATSTLL